MKLNQTFSNSDLEAAFQKNYFENTINQMRWALILAACLVASFSLLDIWVVPDVKESIWIIRFGIMIPTLVIVLVMSFTSWFKNFWKWLISLAGLIIGLSISGMVLIGGENGSLLYPAGLPLVIIWYIFSGLTLLPTTIASILIVISYSIVSLVINTTPLYLVLNHHFFLISSLLLVSIVAYIIEKRLRDAFTKEIGKEVFKTIRSIEFSPENYNIVIIVLYGFIRILTDKYSGQNIHYTINQETSRVILTIVTPDNDCEIIKKLLADYSLALMHKKQALIIYNDQLYTEVDKKDLNFEVNFREKLKIIHNEDETNKLLQRSLETKNEIIRIQKERIKKLEGEQEHMKEHIEELVENQVKEIIHQLTVERWKKNPLTHKQLQVLKFRQEEGSTICSIANAMGLAEKTVETHLKNIKDKLDIHDLEDLKKFDMKLLPKPKS